MNAVQEKRRCLSQRDRDILERFVNSTEQMRNADKEKKNGIALSNDSKKAEKNRYYSDMFF